jgi:hypothetical protein
MHLLLRYTGRVFLITYIVLAVYIYAHSAISTFKLLNKL